MDYFHFWFIASILFFALEALGASGIGLLFAAIAALCMGLLVQSGVIAPDNYLAQTAGFFTLTALCALLLWKPLKKMRLAKAPAPHHDMVGRFAIVGDAGLTKNKTGAAMWSGTSMYARLADDAAIEIAAGGEELKIVNLDGSTLLLAQKDYPLKDPS